MKRFSLPSVLEIWTALLGVIRRFPWPVLVAVVGVVAAIAMAEIHPNRAEEWFFTRVLMGAFLALPLTNALRVAAESRGLAGPRRLLLEAAGVAAVIAYCWSLPADQERASEAVFIRTGLLALGLHFVVSVGPFLGRWREAAFWDYNWRLFQRFCLGVLYSVVLYGGLAIAMGSASHLFEFKIKGERYYELWVIVAGLFNTCFFLHGVPRDFDAAPAAAAYPKGLRMFAQYALAPLVVVYLGILYPYAVKIAITGQWPKGWVSFPVLCLAVVGILAALFLHPIQDRPEECWAAWYWRWFFRAFLPLTALLYLALKVRSGEYGVTESRYFGFVLAGWLALASVYFWWPANRGIRWMPASLALLCFGAAAGPWGAFAISEHSQFGRLQGELARLGLLTDGVLTPRKQSIEQKQYESLRSMIRYLRSRHDSEKLNRLLEPFFARPGEKPTYTRKFGRVSNAWGESEDVLAWLEVVSLGSGGGRWFSIQAGDEPGSIEGYSSARVVWMLNRGMRVDPTNIAGDMQFELKSDNGVLVIHSGGAQTEAPELSQLLQKALQEKTQGGTWKLHWEKLSAPVAVGDRECLLVVLQAQGDFRDDAPRLNSLSLLVLER